MGVFIHSCIYLEPVPTREPKIEVYSSSTYAMNSASGKKADLVVRVGKGTESGNKGK